MAYDYLNSDIVTPNAVIPAYAGIQSYHGVQSSSNAQLDTRLRGYDKAACASQITVIPANAGIQSHYEVQSYSNAELDTRVRGYDVARFMATSAETREIGIAVMPAYPVIPANAGIQTQPSHSTEQRK